MDNNNLTNCDNVVQTNNQHLQHDHGHHTQAETQADIASAKMAWEAWKSNDPAQIDQALAERQRLLHSDPRAWKIAMKEVDAEDKIRKAELQKEMAAEAQAVPAAATIDATTATASTMQPGAPDAPVAAPPVESQTVMAAEPEAIAHPGYSPTSPFAPPPPNNPAYDAAYNQPAPKFYGLNLGLLKIGVTNHGSLDVGVNIGIARGEAQVGLENRVDGEFMPVGGPIHARVGAGIGINRYGLHSEVGAGGNFFNIANVDADFGGHLGQSIGVDGGVRGRALLVNGEGQAGAAIGPEGLSAHGGGNADLVQAIGARGGGRVDLGSEKTGIAAGVGVNAGGHTLDFGPSVDVQGPAVVPEVHLDPGTADKSTFFPVGNRAVDQPAGQQ